MTVDHNDADAIATVAAAYALDALSPNETRQVRDHLPTCIKCRDEVARMREAAAVLAYTVEPVEPPAELRRKVLERSRSESAEPSGIRLVPEPE
jgi:anti-sigma factor RsiW